MIKNLFDKNLSPRHLRDLVVLCTGAALLIAVAALMSDSADRSVQGSASTQVAAIGYALSQIPGMKSFGDAAGPNAHTNPTNSTNGWPAPKGCSFGSDAAYETCVHNNSNNIFGVFSGKNTADTINLGKGKINYFKAEPSGDDLDGFRMFWSPPTITHTRVTTCFSDSNCVTPPTLTGDDLRRDFNAAFHIEDDGSDAPDKVAGNNSTFSGGNWLVTKANLYSSKNKEATGKQFQNVSATTRTYSLGSDVVIPVGGSARLEWVCQPYQINYWDAFCGSLNNSKCTNARILDLFDRVATNIPGVSAGTINGSATVSPTSNTTYTLKCRSEGRSAGPVTYGIPPTSPSSPVEGPYRFSYTTDTEDGPLMSVTVKVANAPTSRIQANGAAYNTNIAVAAGTSVSLHANYTIDPDDLIKDTRIMRDGTTVVYTQSSASADITAPSFAAVAGTAYTYTPQIRTLGYPAWRNSGGSVRVTVCQTGQVVSGGACVASSAATSNLIPNGNTGAADNVAITTGGAVAFSWTSANVSNCTLTRIPTTAPWSGTTAGATGASRSVTFPAAGTFTYRLTCTAQSGLTSPPVDDVVVTVSNAAAPTANISSTASVVNKGSSTQLGWQCTNSTTARVTNNRNATVWTTFPAQANPPGQSTGPLSQSTTYTLVCTNASGTTATDTQLVQVDICTDISGVQPTVLPAPCLNPGATAGACVPPNHTFNGSICVPDPPDPPPPPPTTTLVSFAANPTRVKKTETTTLEWTITGPLTGCSISSNPDSATFPYTVAAGTGSVESNPITQTTVFTLSCGAAGSLQKTVTVIPQFQEL
jgi:plastocyanin